MKSFALICLIFIIQQTCLGQMRNDIIIHEIMPDPTPTEGLPAYEWIEIRNRSSQPIQLAGWRLSRFNTQSAPFPSYLLKPDSLLIICGTAAFAEMSAFGPTVAISSFPTLNNDADLLYLSNANHEVIHAINYDASWYGNDLKKEGGWSLEMMDHHNPCTGLENWAASVDLNGGTPGNENSRAKTNPDIVLPRLIKAIIEDSINIQLLFDEPLNAADISNLSHYQLSNGISIVSAISSLPLGDRVSLRLSSPLETGIIYTITVNGIADCAENLTEASSSVKTGLPENAIANDIAINEILFNPASGGYDYIELFNNSSKIVDAAKLSIANRNSSGSIASIKQASADPHYLLPGEWILITENKYDLELRYLVKKREAIAQIPALPSFPDDEGFVILLNNSGDIIDEVHYHEDWHFALLNDKEGISLERLDADASSNEKGNWHSASVSAGYGTPGYKNSQYIGSVTGDEAFEINPKVFSPNNDGVTDITSILYKLEEPGFVGTIIIFNASGIPVRQLLRNQLLSREGYFRWDGLDEVKKQLAPGVYIVWIEVFNLQGKKQQFKKTVILKR